MAKLVSEILDLKSHELIDEQVAERQKEVILKGFKYLSKPENSFLYIGDEVGLGKTYIALGIMSLLRHFSDNHENHKDLIIVPKSNLQSKWQKEIRNFIKTNFKYNDSRVKTFLNTSIGTNDDSTYFNEFKIPETNNAAYFVYRMSSFSIGVNKDNWAKWIEGLSKSFSSGSTSAHYFNEGKKLGYFRKKDDSFHEQRLKRFYAYLMNLSYPSIDCLIVDEAHNYRKGNTDKNMSARNAVTSCLFGITNEELVKGIFDKEGQEELNKSFFEAIKPKAKKTIFLSATPINYSLVDLKNQLDCFIKYHKITKENVKEELQNFMIRGIMNLKINENTFSRNQYRFEHRCGKVIEKEEPEPQRITKDKDAITLGLFQYNIIKELHKPKYNKSFEIGMLSGFETFSKDSRKIISKEKDKAIKEYEEENNRNAKVSADSEVIKKLIESYQETIKKEEYPPHPKQDNLIEELYKNMINQKKSLVFVRRVASTVELEQKLMRKYEADFVFTGIINKAEFRRRFNSKELRNLTEKFKERVNEEKIDKAYSTLYSRIEKSLDSEVKIFLENEQDGFYKQFIDYEQLNNIQDEREAIYKKNEYKIKLWFDFLRTEYKKKFNDETIKKIIGLERISSKYQENTKRWLKNTIEKWQEEINQRKIQIDDELKNELKEQRENERYFFNSYFSKNEGLTFRSRIRRQDWFEFNYFLINEKYELHSYDETKLKEESFSKNITDNRIIDKYTDIFKEAVIDNNYSGNKIVPGCYKVNTVLTKLLTEHCNSEFSTWLEKMKKEYQSHENLFEEIDILESILKNIFRNGSGLLPAFIADKASLNKNDSILFDKYLIELLTDEKYFPFVLDEIKSVLSNYTILRSTNFSDSENIDKQVNKVNALFANLAPVIGTSGQDKLNKRRVAAQFRLPGFPYVLITTDILKEGEDLHTFCKNIYHYGIAWNPIDMEQRTGRIDRIGSFATRFIKSKGKIDFEDKVQIFFPYLTDTLEVNQVIKVLANMNEFVDSFYDFTKTYDTDSTVAANEEIKAIPLQRMEKLESKYEYTKFHSELENVKVEMLEYGNLEERYKTSLQELTKKINESFAFFTLAHLDQFNYSISGTIKLQSSQSLNYNHFNLKIDGLQNERRGHFKISLGYNPETHQYIYKLYSKICRTTNKVNAIKQFCKSKLTIIEYNDNLLLKEVLKENDQSKIIEVLKESVYISDILEYHFMDRADDELGF